MSISIIWQLVDQLVAYKRQIDMEMSSFSIPFPGTWNLQTPLLSVPHSSIPKITVTGISFCMGSGFQTHHQDFLYFRLFFLNTPYSSGIGVRLIGLSFHTHTRTLPFPHLPIYCLFHFINSINSLLACRSIYILFYFWAVYILWLLKNFRLCTAPLKNIPHHTHPPHFP